jgi:hypothetical protein
MAAAAVEVVEHTAGRHPDQTFLAVRAVVQVLSPVLAAQVLAPVLAMVIRGRNSLAGHQVLHFSTAVLVAPWALLALMEL